jgi:thioredoxin 1
MVKELTDNDFESTIKKGNYVVDFWASWCGPCMMMKPEFEAAAKELKGINLAKVDVDANNKLSEKYEIRSIPTMIFFKDGKEVSRNVGAIGKEEIISLAKDTFK